MITKVPVITIDGPSASGKGTISKLIAAKLGWHFLDSGVLYRALAYALLKSPEVNADNLAELANLVSKITASFPVTSDGVVLFNGVDIVHAMRSEECGVMASRIAPKIPVREALLEWQRTFRKPPGLVADGRDMGTVVFPDATLKIFLIASSEERANRRYKQLKERGINGSLQKILDDLRARDERDMQRDVAPLRPAKGAVTIDTTELSVSEVVAKIIKELK